MLLLLLSIPVTTFFWKSCNLVRSYAVSWILFLITMSSGKWHSSQNYANLSLFFALCFSTTTCPNEASNFTFRFSPSLFQALSYTCLSFPCSLKTISVTYSQRRNKQASSAFKLVQNRTAIVQARNSRLLFQQRSLMNKTVKTGVSLYAEMEEKRRSSIPACPQHTLGIQYKE